MKRPLRLAVSGVNEQTAKRDSFLFPTAAASALTPSAPRLQRTGPLPFPFSHPENLSPRLSTARPAAAADPASMFGVIPTRDLIRQIDQTLDLLSAKASELSDQVESLPFPGQSVDDEHRPWAA